MKGGEFLNQATISFSWRPLLLELIICIRAGGTLHVCIYLALLPSSSQATNYLSAFKPDTILSGVRRSPFGTAATTGLSYQPYMTDDGDCGATGGMKIGRGNWSTQRKPVPVPLCPRQIPHDLTWAWTQAPRLEARDQPPELWHGQSDTMQRVISYDPTTNCDSHRNSKLPSAKNVSITRKLQSCIY
jgi:hypothetical protein